MAWSDSATTAFSLELIEVLARNLISEYIGTNPRRNDKGVRISRLSTHVSSQFLASRCSQHCSLCHSTQVMPTAHAHAALGYAASRRAQAPLNPLELKVGTAALADLANAKKAARCYDLAYRLFPNDYYGKPSIGFKALEM